MKIGLLFNCQGRGLAAALRAMIPDAEVEYHSVTALNAEGGGDAVADALERCDVVFSSRMGGGGEPGAKLLSLARKFRFVPPLNFRGFHPDQVYIQAGGRNVTGPTGDYHSRIAIAAFLGGLAAEQAAGLYHRLAFARLGYLRAYDEDFVLLSENLAAFGMDAEGMVARLRDAGCFMHSCNHPKPVVAVEMAALMCAMIGVAPRRVEADAVPDFLAQHGSHPVFADIAAACGVAPEGAFRAAGGPDAISARMDTEEFVAGSFAAYRDVDRAFLRRASGVAAAMAALDLVEHAPEGGRRHWTRNMALMTWHGTLVRHTAAGAAVHLPLSVPDAAAPLLRADLHGATLPERLPVLGGVHVRAAAWPDMLGLQRGQSWLGADRETAQMFFVRQAAGDWESFLPVSDAQLDALRRLLQGEWAVEGAGASFRAALDCGPAVWLGAGRIELVQSWPRVLPEAADGGARLAVRLDGAPAVLRQTARPVPAAASTALRKIGLDELIVLAGEPVFLPLPLTLSNADRVWLHEACGEAEGLPWLHKAPEAKLHREADQRMLGAPPAPGEALPEQGVLEQPVAMVAPPGGEAAEDWAPQLLRLLAMASYLPSGTRVLAPADGGEALAGAWQALGLPPIELVQPPTGIYVARDVTWLDPASPCQWPAETLVAARNIAARGARAGGTTIVLMGRQARRIGGLAAIAQSLGCSVVDLGGGSKQAQFAQLRDAGLVIGVGEDLLAAAFCPQNTKIIELCGEEFVPDAWFLSSRLGLTHAVLPCPGWQVDPASLARLMTLVNLRSP